MKIGSLQVVSAGFEGVGRFASLSHTGAADRLASREPSHYGVSPYVDANDLTTAAAREYLYITLYEILLDALAAEHGMRLMAAESALEWLENTSATTARRLTSAKSEAATQELLDIVGGRSEAIAAEMRLSERSISRNSPRVPGNSLRNLLKRLAAESATMPGESGIRYKQHDETIRSPIRACRLFARTGCVQ